MSKHSKLLCCLFAACAFGIVTSCCDDANAVQWINTTNGHYTAGSNWSGGSAPSPTQTADFNTFAGSPVLWATTDTTSGNVRVSQNSFTFTGCCGAPGIPFTHTVDGFLNVFSGGGLTLGNQPDEPMIIDVLDHFEVENASTVNVRHGSELYLTSLGLATSGSTFNFAPSTINVDSSTIGLGATFDPDFDSTWDVGGAEQTGIVNIANGSTVTLGGLNLATGARADGQVHVSGGSDLWLASDIFLATTSATAAVGEITVSGANSNLIMPAASDLNVGAASASSGSLIVENGGVLFIGGKRNLVPVGTLDGGLDIRSTGSVEIRSGGTLAYAAGTVDPRIKIDGGELRFLAGSAIAGQSNVKFQIQNGGLLDMAFGLTFGLGADISVTSGGVFQNGGVLLGAGSSGVMTIDGGTFESSGDLGVGNMGVLTLDGSNGLIDVASFTSNSGGAFNHNRGTLRVDGGAYTPAAGIVKVEGSTGLATLHLKGAGAASVGEMRVGSTDLNSDGELIVSDGRTLTINGRLEVGESGVARVESGGTILTANDNDVTFWGQGAAARGFVSGPTSSIEASRNFGIGFGQANQGHVTLEDGGSLIAGREVSVAELSRLNGNGFVQSAIPVRNFGHVAPGLSTGRLDVIGSFINEPTGTLEIEVGGAGPGEFDQLVITGTAILGGELEVTDLVNTAVGTRFEVLTAASVTGVFATETLPLVLDGTEWYVIYASTSVELVHTWVGDFDLDGDVDGDDFLDWQAGFGITASATRADGDADADGDVDGDDFLIWQSMFGSAPGSSAGSRNAVPEPSAVAICLACLVCFGRIVSSRRA